jgi:hypothetical protein
MRPITSASDDTPFRGFCDLERVWWNIERREYVLRVEAVKRPIRFQLRRQSVALSTGV